MLSLVLGILSGVTLIIGALVLILGGSWAWITISFIAAIIGIIAFIMSLVNYKKSGSPGSIIASVIGVILSLLSGIIGGIIIFENL